VLGYVHAEVVEAACTRIELTRAAIGRDGMVSDPALREKIAETVAMLARHVADRDSGE
jgi:chromate reductase, NAD(P)H dehydrogenase (quinone)